ncbi:glycosyltransferase [Microbacterium sp. HA-8]|uniref:glycosyltransferase n=1 Tax=Microbacterium sp. HA-8 TaxID=3234200 RepID=UPI0038F741E9
MGIQTSLDAVAQAPTIVDALRLADDLAFEAGRDPGMRTLRVLDRAMHGDDQLVVIAAVHALAEINDGEAARSLVRLLDDPRTFVREHTAWALGAGLPRPEAIGRMLSLVAAGGFTGMLAQRSLEQWSAAVPELLVVGVEGALLGVAEPGARGRLVETLGLVRAAIATAPLLRVAVDDGEHDAARIAAIAALGQRARARSLVTALEGLVEEGGVIGDVAGLALRDLEVPAPAEAVRTEGLTIAQLFLHADIDPRLSAAGAGDNGGIATLLVRLGDALSADPSPTVRRVITLSRGAIVTATSDLSALRDADEGHVYGRIPLLRDPVPSAAAWPLRVTVRRGIRRVLRAAGGVDLLHLRMADVGSLAAADVARELGIPVVFTVAPDPHGVIESLDRAGRITRADFGDIDLLEHFWFRTRLVQSLAANAAHTVFFPRPRLEDDIRRLVGIDMAAHAERHSIVPEGVDLVTIEAALADATAAAGGAPAVPAIAELQARVADLAPHRRGLPLVVSVGRLHRVKGMAALVEAWSRAGCAERANLLIVGGDLEHPSLDEREQLERIEKLVPAHRRAEAGLILPGHRPNDITARWLAAARTGLPGFVAPRGVYACASIKEEFGIALLEAMAAGLYVVAPDGGGPATYVEHAVTGELTETWDVEALSAALDAALGTADAETDDARAERARAMVRERFTIQRMATALDGVYGRVARDEAELRAVVETTS